MKKRISICLVFMLVFGMLNTAFALNYTGRQGNEATFETLSEVRVNSIPGVQNLEQNATKTFKSHPVLDCVKDGTVFVYRSANLFGGRAAARLNTNIVVYAEQHFETKDEAFAYLTELGLIDIIDEAIGSVVLVTPANGTAFGAADQTAYYALQTAMLAQKARETVVVDGVSTRYFYSDAEYFGGYGYLYVIGIDGGATFLNNYVAGTFDFVSRIAGMLLIGGTMESFYKVANFVPVYMVNPQADVLAKYKAANGVDAYELTDKTSIYYNNQFPLRKVVIAEAEKTNAEYIKNAYYDLFTKAMRVPVQKAGLYTAGTPYTGYSFDQAPYSLCKRNLVVDGKTADGLYVIMHQEDRFADMKAPDNGEWLQTWFEYLPEEIVNCTAAEHSIPLILANHGGSDDPRVFVDELGLLTLAGEQRIAIVAPEHNEISGEYREVEIECLPALVHYMLDTYPALDPTRVYGIGYSMGGSATLKAIYGEPSLFAAVVAMSPVHGLGEFYEPDPSVQDLFDGIALPIMMHTSGFDLGLTVNPVTHNIEVLFQKILNRILGYNHLDLIDEFDFESYPLVGFKADKTTYRVLNGEYGNYTYYLNNDAGIPMVAVNYTEGLTHALYPQYGYVGWDFMKHYIRDIETLKIIYNPYVD